MTLNPFAVGASERSKVVAGIARLNRRQFHGRAASRALWTLVLCIEHGSALVRRSEFSGKPTSSLRFEGIRCNDVYLNVIAPRALEQPLFEANWPR